MKEADESLREVARETARRVRAMVEEGENERKVGQLVHLSSAPFEIAQLFTLLATEQQVVCAIACACACACACARG